MQDKFLSDIKDTWQSVELSHQDLLKKARQNLTFHRCGLAYNNYIGYLLYCIGYLAGFKQSK